MAQIVHDLAPGATLCSPTSGSSQLEMANHIRALRDAGAQVIVDDIIYPDETMYQDGSVAAAVDEVAADGVAYFSSAGNGTSPWAASRWAPTRRRPSGPPPARPPSPTSHLPRLRPGLGRDHHERHRRSPPTATSW